MSARNTKLSNILSQFSPLPSSVRKRNDDDIKKNPPKPLNLSKTLRILAPSSKNQNNSNEKNNKTIAYFTEIKNKRFYSVPSSSASRETNNTSSASTITNSSLYLPLSRYHLLLRISTYNSSNWNISDDSIISSLECSRYGWEASKNGINTISCCCCYKKLIFNLDFSSKNIIFDNLTDDEEEEGNGEEEEGNGEEDREVQILYEKYHELLVLGHSDICPWKLYPSPLKIYNIDMSMINKPLLSLTSDTNSLTNNDKYSNNNNDDEDDYLKFINNWKRFIDTDLKFPIDVLNYPSILNNEITDDFLLRIFKSIFDNDNSNDKHHCKRYIKENFEFYKSSFILSLFGWSLSSKQLSSSIQLVSCQACNRRAPLNLSLNTENNDLIGLAGIIGLEDDGDSDLDRRFNVIKEHKCYCFFVKSYGNEKITSITTSGWEKLLLLIKIRNSKRYLDIKLKRKSSYHDDDNSNSMEKSMERLQKLRKLYMGNIFKE